MKIRLILLPILGTLLLCGCRKDPYMQVYVDNMNAEKRLLEDTMYEMQRDLDAKVEEVDKLRRELERLRSGGTSVLDSDSSSTESSGPRSRRAPRDLFPGLPDLRPPTIEEGAPSEKKPRGDSGKSPEDDSKIDDVEPPKLDLGEGDSLSSGAKPIDQQITKLHVDPEKTRGLQQDQQPGDDGIVLVLEPRNDAGEFVPQPGRVSIVLLDPETRQRVARWEFSEEQTRAALRKDRSGKGIELALPWQKDPPSKERLHLFVRFWLPDGSAVESDREIMITPGKRLTARWTPRTLRRPKPRQRVNVADNLEAESSRSEQTESANSRPPDNWEAAREEGTSRPPARQAGLPQWRPYR